MEITATMVKELRERTGAGMMECKKVLSECGGDMDAAVELLRKSGQAKADKKASRIAAEGAIGIAISGDHKKASIVEINCETDFVAKDASFQKFASDVAGLVLKDNPADVERLIQSKLPAYATVENARLELISKIGENIQIRRFMRFDAGADRIGHYSHGYRIGVLVVMNGGDEVLHKDIAMHIAASRPLCVNDQELPRELLEKEKVIFTAQAKESGKPDAIIEKMVQGKISKFINDNTLLGQPFVKDPDKSIRALLKEKNATVKTFSRYEVGEGIEKKSEDFAREVLSQVERMKS